VRGRGDDDDGARRLRDADARRVQDTGGVGAASAAEEEAVVQRQEEGSSQGRIFPGAGRSRAPLRCWQTASLPLMGTKCWSLSMFFGRLSCSIFLLGKRARRRFLGCFLVYNRQRW